MGYFVSVPKCKNCNYLKEVDSLAGINSGDKRRIHTELTNNRTCFHTTYIQQKKYPVINSNEMKTSPKWCPLREK